MKTLITIWAILIWAQWYFGGDIASKYGEQAGRWCRVHIFGLPPINQQNGGTDE